MTTTPEPVDLTVWREDAEYLRKRGSCTLATQTQAQRVLELVSIVRAQRAALEAAPIAQAMSALESDATKDQRRAAWDALADWADSSGTVLARTRDEKG